MTPASTMTGMGSPFRPKGPRSFSVRLKKVEKWLADAGITVIRKKEDGDRMIILRYDTPRPIVVLGPTAQIPPTLLNNFVADRPPDLPKAVYPAPPTAHQFDNKSPVPLSQREIATILHVLKIEHSRNVGRAGARFQDLRPDSASALPDEDPDADLIPIPHPWPTSLRVQSVGSFG